LLGALYDHAFALTGPVATAALVAGAAVVYASGAGVRKDPQVV
jgi:hypothetical protein